MSSPDPKHPWSRLTAAARQLPEDRDASAPYGFATRIAALAVASETRATSLLERFALRAVGVACALALLSVAVNYPALANGNNALAAAPEEDLPDDAIAVVLDYSD